MIEPDYINARRVLLDALEALDSHLDSLVLVGAQAVYLHTGDATLAVAEYTNDADLAIDPASILKTPIIGESLEAAGFLRGPNPGRWISSGGIPLDLMVPESLAGSGSRGADLRTHGRLAARRAHGLEACLIDRDPTSIGSLEAIDQRSFLTWVAGPGALLVAKLIKIGERLGQPGRLRDKDALDVFRLLQAIPMKTLAERLGTVRIKELSRSVTTQAIEIMEHEFANQAGEGVEMVVRATETLENPETIRASVVTLSRELLAATSLS